ncbi:hypothetical protein GCM10008066_21260 [Oxalicibacterium faecigallinarum]|uniref:Uncharacterized protein n=1 Tax=Oxalicibacterium faecigallinarum TaxID=573741 RepID=A0A8J3AYU4_9BURK|nr:hypothetical protein GCM10008066_21260 [Oxalicibacterium faecigallinarum]
MYNMAKKTAATPQAALPSVKKSARWNSRSIEKCLRGGLSDCMNVCDPCHDVGPAVVVSAQYALKLLEMGMWTGILLFFEWLP